MGAYSGNRQTHRQTDRQRDRQTDREGDDTYGRKTETHKVHINISCVFVNAFQVSDDEVKYKRQSEL